MRPLSVTFFISISLLLVIRVAWAQETEINPPAKYYREVTRSLEGHTTFPLIQGRPTFSILVSDPSDTILTTAAEDLSRYFRERLGIAPEVLFSADTTQRNLIVLATLSSIKRLPDLLRDAANGSDDLSEQAYVIKRVQMPSNKAALLCIGGSPIAARYATVDILRRAEYNNKKEAFVAFDRLRDEPYFPWRAIYINDSAHQLNNYNPNLIYDVDTYRWPLDKWRRYIDQMAFFRYNVLQIWIVPNMFSPEVFHGGGAFDYFRDTMRAVAQYAKPRGITLSLVSPINVAVEAGTRLDSLPIPAYKSLPIYTYLSPNKPEEKALSLRLWDYWSKAIPEVGVWQIFPGDPGGCHEQGCGPETYVDLAIEVSRIIKRNNPGATIDFTPWQFFGWGPSWVTRMREDTARIDRGYKYLIANLGRFPPDTIFSPNLNDYTSEPPVKNGGSGGGSTVKYIEAMSRKHLVHTWTYFVTEGEGWINHHYRVPEIVRQRDIEARFPISGGLCYTMTPSLNLLNQFACAESFWDPTLTVEQIMQKYTEGIFGTSQQRLINIFPSFEIAPMVGYTFADSPEWQPDYNKILRDVEQSRAVLESLKVPEHPRFVILSPADYVRELIYFCRLYEDACKLGIAVTRARALIHRQPEFSSKNMLSIRIGDARAALGRMGSADRRELEMLLREIESMNVPAMKERFRAKHYQIFLDHPTEFTLLLPKLIDGFFAPFGADFLNGQEAHS